MHPSTARWVYAGAVASIAAAALSVATRRPDPPHVEPLPPPTGFVPLPRPTPMRTLPLAPLVVDWALAERPDPEPEASPVAEWVDLVIGWGAPLFVGEVAMLEVTAWRGDGGWFESSYEQEGPVRWVVEPGAMPPGLVASLPGMRAGGTRVVWLEPDAVYGGQGLAGRIPPGVGVQFEVELVEVWAPPSRAPELGERAGSGPLWEAGRPSVVDYAVWSTAEPGLPLDSSYGRWYPHPLAPRAPALFEAALEGLRVGGRRVVRGSVDDLFGPAGRPPLAPPGSDLVLQVELRSQP